MLCAGPPFCGFCNERSTLATKPAIVRTIAAPSYIALPMIHASDCSLSEPDNNTAIIVFDGRNRGGSSKLPTKPLLDAMPTTTPTCSRMTVYLLSTPGNSQPVQTLMCNPDHCTYCSNRAAPDSQKEKDCIPSGSHYESCRAAAVEAKGKPKAVLHMLATAPEVLIDPKLLSGMDDTSSDESDGVLEEENGEKDDVRSIHSDTLLDECED